MLFYNKINKSYLLCIIPFLILIKLGLWQIERGLEKKQLIMVFKNRQHQNIVLSENIENMNDVEHVEGYKTSLYGQPLKENSFFVDNTIYQQQVGFKWLLPIYVSDLSVVILLDMGFVSKKEMDALPDFNNDIMISGIIYIPKVNPFNHKALLDRSLGINIIQAIEWDVMQQYFNVPLLPLVVFIDDMADYNALIPIWKVVNMSEQKHWGYALQWFLLAGALLYMVLMHMKKNGVKKGNK